MKPLKRTIGEIQVANKPIPKGRAMKFKSNKLKRVTPKKKYA